MADSVLVTDGTTSIQLVYNASSQTEYKLKYGAQVGIDPPDVLTHTPDFGESLPVRGVDRDRTVTLGMHFPPQSDWDEVLNSISKLKRMVDGAHSQALRYWTDGDVDRVNLRIQLNGSSNYTDIPIKYGVVDDGGALYSAPAILNQTGYDAAVVLIVGPYGEGAAISLRNDLASSPHMLEDSNGDGRADGWSATGTPTTTISSVYLIGGNSQRIVTDSSTSEGITQTVTASAGTDAVAYCWLYATASGNDPIFVVLRNGSSTQLDLETFNPASPSGYDKTAVDVGGRTWYRYSVSGTNTGVANFILQIYRSSGVATQETDFFVDGAYLQTGTLTAPDAWCSTSAITNGHDTDASTANINYLDFWGIPGDARCYFEMTVDPSSGTITDYYIGKYEQKSGILPIHWVSQVDSTAVDDTKLRYNNVGIGKPDGTQSTVADGNRFSDEYLRLTADASPDTDNLYVPLYSSSTAATQEAQFFQFLSCGHRIYMIARSSNASTTFQLVENEIVDIFSLSSSGVLRPSTTNTWELYDLGFISQSSISNFVQDNYDSFSSFEPLITVDILPGTASATVDVDAVIFVPVSSGGSFAILGQKVASNTIVGSSVFSSDGKLYVDTEQFAIVGISAGEIDGFLPGNAFTRLVFLMNLRSSTNVTVPVTTTATITTSIKPRTRHLLGVS